MKHYDITEWLDYVHGLVGEEKRATMGAHAAECRGCAEIAGWLQKLVAAAMGEYRVPEHAVRMARAVYALQCPENVQVVGGAAGALRAVGRLVFDSFREPVVAGVRSGQKIARQTLYEAGNYSVDLRMELERGERRVSLVGQVVNRVKPEECVAELAVVLMSGKDVVGRAKTNAFGEFQMEYEPRQPLSLWLPGAPSA